MIHNADGKKLSKRDGATDVMAYKEMGYLPEALLNFLVRLGWSNGDQEIFNLEEMLTLFDPSNINKSASIYNIDKLDWLNAHYIKNSKNTMLATLLHESYGVNVHGHDQKEILLDALKERAKNMKELAAMIPGIIEAPSEYDDKAVKKAFKDDAFAVLEAFVVKLEKAEELHLPTDYHHQMEELVGEIQAAKPKDRAVRDLMLCLEINRTELALEAGDFPGLAGFAFHGEVLLLGVDDMGGLEIGSLEPIRT